MRLRTVGCQLRSSNTTHASGLDSWLYSLPSITCSDRGGYVSMFYSPSFSPRSRRTKRAPRFTSCLGDPRRTTKARQRGGGENGARRLFPSSSVCACLGGRREDEATRCNADDDKNPVFVSGPENRPRERRASKARRPSSRGQRLLLLLLLLLHGLHSMAL
jgi:hypothetical protein